MGHEDALLSVVLRVAVKTHRFIPPFIGLLWLSRFMLQDIGSLILFHVKDFPLKTPADLNLKEIFVKTLSNHFLNIGLGNMFEMRMYI